jgi:hypothetical protein
MAMIRSNEGESTSLADVQDNATFPILYPTYLPPVTSVIAGRWWAGGEVVELHIKTETGDLLRGRITIKEWTEAGVSSAGRPGRNANATRVKIGEGEWFWSPSEISMLEGRSNGLNIQILTVFPLEVAAEVAGSLAPQ